MSRGPGRTGSRWRRAHDECMTNAQAYNLPCCLCGQPINYALTQAFPLHRMAGTVHHLIGLAQGGEPLDQSNLAPAHRGCNTREGNRVRYHQTKIAPLMITSRRW